MTIPAKASTIELYTRMTSASKPKGETHCEQHARRFEYAPPEGHADWLAELKTRIHTAQQRATLAVNRELVLLYWQIGRDILVRQAEQGWAPR